MKHEEVVEHILGCKTCQRASGKLAAALAGLAEAHAEIISSARNAPRNAHRNPEGAA